VCRSLIISNFLFINVKSDFTHQKENLVGTNMRSMELYGLECKYGGCLIKENEIKEATINCFKLLEKIELRPYILV